jgi:tetratricopeptide (TPR) repeat protein
MSNPTPTIPFPFIGAGEASYYEWAEVDVYFARVPSDAERSAIEADVPPPLRASIEWEEPHLRVATGDVHAAITAAYFVAGEESDEDDDESYDDDDEPQLATTAQQRRFNEDIERWLHAAHAHCPILVAFRKQDLEAGGTELSQWHDDSVQAIPRLIEPLGALLRATPGRAPAPSPARWLARRVLRESPVALDRELADLVHPERPLRAALQAGNGQALAALLTPERDEVVLALAAVAQVHDPAHRRALTDALPVLGALARVSGELLCALLTLAAQISDQALAHMTAGCARAREGDKWFAEGVAAAAYLETTARRMEPALRLFDLIIERDDLELPVYGNALYAVQKDNGAPEVDPARARRYLSACLPFAPESPLIFLNAAAVLAELGEHDAAIEHLGLAKDHGFDIAPFRDQTWPEALRRDERFAAVFDRPAAMPGKYRSTRDPHTGLHTVHAYIPRKPRSLH